MEKIKVLKFVKAKSNDDVCLYCFNEVKEELKKNPNLNLGLATGRTPLKFYEYLRCDKSLDLSGVTTFNLDEYLDVSQNDSYLTYMKENLFDHVKVKKYYLPNLDNIYSYDDLTLNNIDVQIVGIGENGHIGFNEPNTPKNSLTHIVHLDEMTLSQNKEVLKESNPRYAITMGLANIMSAKRVILLVSGKSKKEIFEKFMSLDSFDKTLPASILKEHPNLTIITDI